MAINKYVLNRGSGRAATKEMSSEEENWMADQSQHQMMTDRLKRLMHLSKNKRTTDSSSEKRQTPFSVPVHQLLNSARRSEQLLTSSETESSSPCSSPRFNFAKAWSPEPEPNYGPVDIRVENLDSSYAMRDLKTMISGVFEHVATVKYVTIVPQTDGTKQALVQVSNWIEARAALEKVHRAKIGKKRIYVTVQSRSPSPKDMELRHEAIKILNSCPSKSMPFKKFLQTLKAGPVGFALNQNDLWRLRDVLYLTQDTRGTIFVRLESKFASEQNQLNTYSTERPPTTKFNVALHSAVVRNEYYLSECLASVLVSEPSLSLPLRQLAASFARHNGFELLPHKYKCRSVRELVEQQSSVLKIEISPEGTTFVTLSDQRHRAVRAQQLFYLFLRRPEQEMSAEQLKEAFQNNFNCKCDPDTLRNTFPEIIQWTQRPDGALLLRLTAVQQFALRSRNLLLNYGSADVPLAEFEASFERRYHTRIRPDEFGFPSLIGLIRAASHVLYIKGRGISSTVTINRNFLSILKQLKPDVIIPGRNPLCDLRRPTNRQRCPSADDLGRNPTNNRVFKRTFTPTGRKDNRANNRSIAVVPDHRRKVAARLEMTKEPPASPETSTKLEAEETQNIDLMFSAGSAKPLDRSFVDLRSRTSSLESLVAAVELCPPQMFELEPPSRFVPLSPAKDSGMGDLSRSSLEMVSPTAVDLDGSFFDQMVPLMENSRRRRSRLAIKFPSTEQ